LVYVAAPAAAAARRTLTGAEVVSLPAADDLLPALLAALVDAGVEQLLVEGGARLHGAFLRLGAFDAFRLALAPTWLGRGRARLFAGAGLPSSSAPLSLAEVKMLDDLAVLHYVRNSKEETP
jgi:5-amino-6-(5-phosphoribosylamino)uracil reductase